MQERFYVSATYQGGLLEEETLTASTRTAGFSNVI